MPSFGDFIHTQLVLKIPIPSVSFSQKTVIITGGSGGLGKEIAKHIVLLGASKVILACRNTSKGEENKAAIVKTLKCKPEALEVWDVDLESPASVKKFVDRVNELPRLDVLINNAGMQTIKFRVAYGTEKTIAVNVIGTFLLAIQLIPKMRETAKAYSVKPHMTFTGSALYDVAKYPEIHGDNIFTWLGEKEHANMMNEYNLSKLLLLHAMIKLSSLVNPSNDRNGQNPEFIVVNSLDPCFCKTGLAGELSGSLKLIFKSFEKMFARTAEEGSRLVVIAASAGDQTHGGYMRAGSLRAYEPFVTSEIGEKRGAYIWSQLTEKLEQLQSGIMANLNAV